MGQTQVRWRGNQIEWEDGTTHETIDVLAPRKQFENFEGVSYDTLKWLYIDVAEGAEALDGLGNLLLSIDATANNQEAGIVNQANVLNWDISKGLNIEFRAKLLVLPTLDTEFHFGILGEAHAADKQIASADDYGEYCVFLFDASGAALIYADDATANVKRAIATGVILTNAEFHIFRIDFTDDENVLFFIDGACVGSTTTFDMSDIASPLVQPYVNITKHGADAGLGSITLDSIKIWQKES